MCACSLAVDACLFNFIVAELVLKNCDTTAKIPIKGPVDSLNASVAAGIAFYELLKNYQ